MLFSEAEIMIGKSISVVLTVLLGALPILAYFINLQIQSGNPFLAGYSNRSDFASGFGICSGFLGF